MVKSLRNVRKLAARSSTAGWSSTNRSPPPGRLGSAGCPDFAAIRFELHSSRRASIPSVCSILVLGGTAPSTISPTNRFAYSRTPRSVGDLNPAPDTATRPTQWEPRSMLQRIR